MKGFYALKLIQELPDKAFQQTETFSQNLIVSTGRYVHTHSIDGRASISLYTVSTKSRAAVRRPRDDAIIKFRLRVPASIRLHMTTCSYRQLPHVEISNNTKTPHVGLRIEDDNVPLRLDADLGSPKSNSRLFILVIIF